jgi:hypothetical protein
MLLKKALGHVLSCKDVTHLVSQMQERRLGPFERWALRVHLAVCEACTRFEAQMRFLQDAMRKYRE